MCLICDGSEVPEDPLRQMPRVWETTMMQSCCRNPWGFLASCLCPCLMACWLRYAALQSECVKMSSYCIALGCVVCTVFSLVVCCYCCCCCCRLLSVVVCCV